MEMEYGSCRPPPGYGLKLLLFDFFWFFTVFFSVCFPFQSCVELNRYPLQFVKQLLTVSAVTPHYVYFSLLVRAHARLKMMIANAFKGQSGLGTGKFMIRSHNFLLGFSILIRWIDGIDEIDLHFGWFFVFYSLLKPYNDSSLCLVWKHTEAFFSSFLLLFFLSYFAWYFWLHSVFRKVTSML